MAHQEFAAGIDRRQHDDEGGEHAGRLLGVAMAHEETAGVVHQELVKFRRDRPGHAETLHRPRYDLGQRLLPLPARNPDPVRVDLPGPPDIGVDQRFFAAAVGRPLGDGDELLGLDRQQRQGDGTDPLHCQIRREDFSRAGRIKITGTLNRAQQLGQFSGDR